MALAYAPASHTPDFIRSVNYWEGDNGGSTAPGVTRDEIRVVVAEGPFARYYEPFVEFFNSRFEFYGRKMRIISIPDPTGGPEAQHASAAAAQEQHAFAAIPENACSRCLSFLQAAAHLGIVSVTFDQEATSDDYRTLRSSWTYLPPIDEVGDYLSELACKSLVGRPASFAGGAERLSSRRFAILVLKDRDGAQRAVGSPLAHAIQDCGGDVSVHEYDGESQVAGGDSGPNRLLMADLQRRGVTTIILFGAGRISDSVILDMMPTASNSGYHPEWITHDSTQEANWRLAPADQTQHLVGLVTRNKLSAVADQPYAWADREVQREPSTSPYEAEAYYEMLVLASGIQAAGPRLTADTFAKGLQGLRFPNPGAGAQPYYQAAVGFAGDHAMIDDTGLAWWSSAAPSYTSDASAVGGWCYVGEGTRWAHRKWPTGEPQLFDPDPRNCR